MSSATTLSATTIIGTDVTNADGQDLGKIEEIVIDLEFGVISYAILSYGGFMGMGNKWFALPWRAFSPSNSEKKFVMGISEDKLKDAEGFDKDSWPRMDRSWGAALHEKYGFSPYWESLHVEV
jgi:sporulation protein YlmC with PRC-barrel domain